MSKLIFCKFINENKEPRGRDYTYTSDIDVQPGDYVLVEVVRSSAEPSLKKVIVTKTDLTPADIPGYDNFKDCIKSIIGLAPTDEETEKVEETKSENQDIPELDLEDL